MGLFSKVKSLFSSKTGQKSSKGARTTGHMSPHHTNIINSASAAPVLESILFEHGNFRTAQPVRPRPDDLTDQYVWSIHPVTGSKFHEVISGDDQSILSRKNRNLDASKYDDIPGPCPNGYMDYWPDFGGDHGACSSDLGSLTDTDSEVKGPESDTSSEMLGLFSPREGEFRTGHVEELENFELKRSNALRERPSASEVVTKFVDTVPDPTARPFSWMLPDNDPLPSLDEIMAHGQQQSERSHLVDGERGFIRSESPTPCSYRTATMRQVTLARLEGRR